MTTDLRAGAEYQAYLRAREAVLEMKQAAVGAGTASAYWTEELENIDYVIDASPLVIRKLRHHAFHITGIRPYDYRDKGDGRRNNFTARLQALHALGHQDLLVPEARALGGFGYDIDGTLLNVDTLKFYEVMIGMERGGVLGALRRGERPVVCEIGAGWGGFAYQFKTLFPSSRYVIVDFPELFLFSATYLAVMFPDARLHFCGTGGTTVADDVADADFVFVPHTMTSFVSSLPLDVTVNMVSFQEMTEAQVRGYADMAAAAGCPLLYSLNRERSPYNTELASVSEALATQYDLTEVPVLQSDYTSAMKKPPKGGRMVERSELGYRHLVGRLDVASRSAGSAVRPSHAGTPRVLLGMTLHNNARHLREAMDSLLSQTFSDFRLFMLDDASTDETEAIAREYASNDARLTYWRHTSRRAMIATWREVAEVAIDRCPSAPYFAWVSDHDRWHPRWLERMVAELDADPGVHLAYPITRRMTQEGRELEKGARLFETVALPDLQGRWAHYCIAGVGAGDMVYGLLRVDTLRRAGIFRTVLRPDRLVITEVTLYGRIRQVPEVLWYRRQSNGTSIARQRHTLLLPGEEPRGFSAPPWWQHSVTLWREYAQPDPPPLPISRAEWRRMLLRYQLAYGWRHFRKSDTSHGINSAINRVVWFRKRLRHRYHHAVYDALVGARALWGRMRRARRRVVYEIAMYTHRLGLRGRGQTPSR